MSGVGAAAGFAFQHARAVVMALDLVHDAEADYIRVEAANDVVDAEMFTATGALLRAAQFKRRDTAYTWGEAELVAELVRWSAVSSEHPGSTYEFVTDGRLGPTGRNVRAALDATRNDDLTLIAEIAERTGLVIDPAAGSRASIIAGAPGFAESIAHCIRRCQSLLPDVSGSVEAEERATQVVLRLLSWVVGRSGEQDPSKRRISKEEVCRLLDDGPEYVRTLSWTNDLKGELVRAAARELSKEFELRCRPTGPHQEDTQSELLENTIRGRELVLLSGPTGAGKSTALRQAQSRAADRGEVFIVVDAEDYVENRLGTLVAQGINSIKFAGAFSATGIAALKDPAVTLVIDGVSEISSRPRKALREELRQLLSAERHAALALCGRESTTLRAVLPRSAMATHLQVEPLTRSGRKAILFDVTEGQIDPVVANQLAARVERALAGAADNPQLFLMGFRMICLGYEVTSPGKMYAEHVRSLAHENGYTEISIYEAALGLAFAHLACTHRRYCDSLDWSKYLSMVAAQLNDMGHPITTGELRDFGFESGLVFRSGRDTIRAIHDSFADYLAAVAYQRRLIAIPSSPTSDDTVRLKFLAELAGVDAMLADHVSTHMPFLCPTVARYESREPGPTWHEETSRHLSHLLPDGTLRPNVAFWIDPSGRLLTTISGATDGWVGNSTVDDVGVGGYTFLAAGGPLTVATKIVKHELTRILARGNRRSTPAPSTNAAAVEMLTGLSNDLHETVPELARRVSPPGTDAVLRSTGPHRIQFLLGGDPDSSDQRERPVRFRYIDDSPDTIIVLTEPAEPDEAWSGSGSVDSFLAHNAIDSASNLITDAINALADMKWL